MPVIYEYFRMRLTRYREWASAVLMTGLMQVGVQLLAFVSGIVILRQLSPAEYAFYTIANTVVGAMNVIADSGLSSAVLALGGEKWQDRIALGRVLSSGLAFRWRLGTMTTVVGLPVLYLLLSRQGAASISAAVISVAVIPSFLLGLSSQLLDVVPRLQQTLFALQRLQIVSNAARALVVTGGVILVPSAALACLLAALPLAWLNRQLCALASNHADLAQAAEPAVETKLRAQVWRKMPEGLYFAISGPMTVWLVALFGTNSSVATVGALGRLAVAFAVLASVFNAIAVPRFARIPSTDVRLLTRRFWQSLFLLLGASTVPLFALYLAPREILAILGSNYSGFVTEALLMAGSGVTGVMVTATMGLGAARGIILPPLISIPYVLIGQITLAYLLPVGTVVGVILLGLISGMSSLLLLVGYVWWKISRLATAKATDCQQATR